MECCLLFQGFPLPHNLPCQVKELRDSLRMKPSPAAVHCEGHALKCFFSYLNRILFVSMKKRAPLAENVLQVFLGVQSFFRTNLPSGLQESKVPAVERLVAAAKVHWPSLEEEQETDQVVSQPDGKADGPTDDSQLADDEDAPAIMAEQAGVGFPFFQPTHPSCW